jgi:hypothetical protein
MNNGFRSSSRGAEGLRLPQVTGMQRDADSGKGGRRA